MKFTNLINEIEDFFWININSKKLFLTDYFFSKHKNIIFLKNFLERHPDFEFNWISWYELAIFLNIIFINKSISPLFLNYKVIIKNIWCNAKCPMCIDWQRKWNLELQKQTLNNVINEIIESKIKKKRVQILWWEPLIIFDEILNIIQKCSLNNIEIDFPTNSSLLNLDRINNLIESWLNKFIFSIDFPTSSEHDEYRKLKGVFEKIINFTNYIKSKNKIVQWNTVVWKFNYNRLMDFDNLYKKTFPNIHNFIWLDENYVDLNKIMRPDDKIVSQIMQHIDHLRQNKGIDFIININYKNLDLKIQPCLIPYYNQTYYIKEEWDYYITPCYTHAKIKDFSRFRKEAFLWKCSDNCNSSCLASNLNLIQKMKYFDNYRMLKNWIEANLIT